MDNVRSQWWQLTISSSEPESDGCQVIELGASGAHVASDNSFHAYFEGSQERLNCFKQQLLEAHFELIECSEVRQENWLEECEELWSPLKFKSLNILPVACAQDVPSDRPIAPTDCFIIPSTGFGTGHHPTTFTLLQFLEHKELLSQPPKRVLDLGTGSGILGIAACKLFNCDVQAIEPDRDALYNARENIEINGLASRITLVQGDLSCSERGYDLILANIYAEILIPLADEFYKRLTQDGQLFLSGIASELVDDIKNSFLEAGFHFYREALKGNWYSAWLKK
jgi:ribosomal protein L11 methyltransferase